jgi:hypothetical protein
MRATYHHTDFGLGDSSSAGKEWWVSEGWGGTALMLAFSATYS